MASNSSASGAVAPVALPATPRGVVVGEVAPPSVHGGAVRRRRGRPAQLHQRHSTTRQG